MTTTACDDQFTAEPEPVNQPYDTCSILRRNVADLELALKQQAERAEAAEAELARLREHEPVVWLSAFGESSIDFEVLLWIDDPEAGLGNVRSEVLKRVWHLFRDHGVEIPFPQRDLHIKEWPALPPREAPQS